MTRKRNKSKKLKTLVDVVIPVHNRFDLLEKCLNSIPEFMEDTKYRIILFDNGSDKLEANSFYAKLDDELNVSVIRSSTNTGFINACNTAARKGTSPLIFFLNSDVVLHPGGGKYLFAEMDDPKVGICGMKLVFPSSDDVEDAELDIRIRSPETVQHVGIFTDIRGRVYHPFVGWSADHPKVNSIHEVYMVTGAALLIRRVLFSKVKGFDLLYGLGTYEDADLCMKIRELGYNIVISTNAVGTHYTGATSEKYKLAFPLGENYNKFVMRWKPVLRQTDIEVL